MKQINKLLFIFLITLFYTNCSTVSISSKRYSENRDNYAKRLELIINNLVSVINQSKNQNKKITELLRRTILRINSNTLIIAVEDNIPENIFEGAFFAFKDDGEFPHISISPYLVDLYDKQPSIIYSILIHEFMHADSFFLNKGNYVLVKDNPNEKYLYELDSYHYEAIFINEYLKPLKNIQITEFEGFLGHSFQNDKLSDFSFSLLAIDMNLVFFLNNITKSKVDKSEKLNKVKKVIDDILKFDYNSGKDEWEKFQPLIPLRTMLEFLTQIIRDIDTYPFSKEDIKRNKNFDLKLSYPEFYGKLEQINSKFNQYQNNFKYYYKIREKFINTE